MEIDSMTENRYDRTAIVLHWMIALLIVGGFYLGWIMTDMAGFSPTKLRYFSWHKWIGVTVFCLVVFRSFWRVTHHVPSNSVDRGGWQNVIANVVHVALYIFMFAIPLSGYLYSSASGIQVVYLGLFPMPTIIHPDQTLKTAFRLVHVALNYCFFALLTLHVSAALKHQFIDRDGVLARMVSFKK